MAWSSKAGALLLAAFVTVGSWGVDAAQPQPATAANDTITGQARVVDGDTLYIGQEKFRLYGVSVQRSVQNPTTSLRTEQCLCAYQPGN